jgi:hypothetical protein
LAQQPVGQEIASQKHCPPMQRCPAAQGPLAPQLHIPLALQVSVTAVAQEWQDVAPLPQMQGLPSVGQGPGIGWRHDDPRQHPPQVLGLQSLQRPSVQVCPAGHA